MQEWLKIPDSSKVNIFKEIEVKSKLKPIAIEKDWWVTQILHQVFELDMADALVFKGGTSLSKGWGLIQRLSEDIDLALDRRYLGFEGRMGKNQVDKLRRVSHQFIREVFYPRLQQTLRESGLEMVTFNFPESSQSDKDPQVIELYYPSVIKQPVTYIQPRILIEIGSRSLFEPFTPMPIQSLVADYFPGKPFADSKKAIPCVNVEKTFLEKLFLLHEEFQKPKQKIRSDRLSRHLYDIERILETAYADKAILDQNLYVDIVQHRRVLTRINGLDYTKHAPKYLNPIPPDSILKSWEEDYKVMQEQMIYGDSLPFDQMLSKLKELKEKINQLDWEIKS